MVVKPVTLVAIAALVVVAAGTGAYLAVRHANSVDIATGDAALNADVPTGLVPISANAPAPIPVEATEEVLTDGADGAENPVALEPREAADERRSARPSAELAGRDARRPADAPPGAQDARALPEPEGWTRINDPWPSSETTPVPDRVDLAMVETDSLGLALTPEARPRIIKVLVLPADSVIGLQVDTPVSSDDAEVEDDVEARVTRDVAVGDEIAVPAGTRVMGSVVIVETAGKIQGVSRLGVRFHTVVMDDGSEVPMVTETVYREGKAKGAESAAKIGGAAVGGAILGAIFGGRQGATIGGAAGAAGGTAMAVAGDAQPATLPAGATVTVRLSRPATVTVER